MTHIAIALTLLLPPSHPSTPQTERPVARVSPPALGVPAPPWNDYLEESWLTSLSDASVAVSAATTSTSSTPTVTTESSSVAIASSVIPEERPLTPIEQGMRRLAELGASDWQLRTFGCLAWHESKNNPYAVSATNDHGLWQANAGFHRWRWAGRDIYDPIVNAEVAWDIYRSSGFRAWTTHRLCGV